ncbi:FAD/NAD(P)-binding domain-containing protein [Pyrenochaeta sp. DS3sAY3a]|nr:FAD/NAD(P)-binding domain-containing protein [Pyrenochaeta sp. DS3sAY3a]
MSGLGFFTQAHADDFATRPVDTPRPIRVIVLGAGMSGILASILFPRGIENLNLVIYEKNPDLGGTWYENKYPGIACDIPSHAYQFTFASNPEWSSYYAPGSEIHAYLKAVTKKYDGTKYMRFNRKVLKAEWDDMAGKWHVHVKNTETGEEFVDTADVVCSAVGILNAWKFPNIPGLEDFKGRLIHSASYDPSVDLTGERVALIGAGSTGIQILPKIQPQAKVVDHYVRSRTWIPPAGIGGEGLMDRGGDPLTPLADLEKFRKDPKAYLEYRRFVENILHRPVEALYQNTDGAQVLKDICTQHMKAKLAKKPEVFKKLLPEFPPGCKRLTPGPGYLEALVEDNVNFISTKIRRVYDGGIETEDGTRRGVDVIICATGFDGVYKQHFPVLGKNGTNLQDLWADIPEAYLSMAPRQMPNYYCFLGPNGGPGLGSACPFLENEARYMVKVIQKIQREYIKSMTAKESAIVAFGKYADRYFNPTIFAATCNAWWKHKGDPNGRLLAIWPGSQLHGSYVFANPRWEDYEYEIRDELKGNPLEWLGNGLTKGQLVGEHTTDYLDTAELDVPVINPLEVEQNKLKEEEKIANGIAK